MNHEMGHEFNHEIHEIHERIQSTSKPCLEVSLRSLRLCVEKLFIFIQLRQSGFQLALIKIAWLAFHQHHQ